MARILIVDDEHLISEMLSTFIRIIGHEPIEAHRGQDVINRLAYDIPDAILMDIMLPDMGGIELCKHIRQHPSSAHVPVIMVSAVSPPRQQEALDAGANSYLTKPITMGNLRDTLSELGI